MVEIDLAEQFHRARQIGRRVVGNGQTRDFAIRKK